MMKKKLVGAREERTALYVLRVQLLGLHLLRDGKKKHRNQGSLRVIQYVRKNVSSWCPQNRQKGKKNDRERAREIEIVN